MRRHHHHERLFVSATIISLRGKKRKYEAHFLITPGMDVVAPATELAAIGVKSQGKKIFLLADGRRLRLSYGSAIMQFEGRITAGRVIFGPEDAEPTMGVMMPESCGLHLDPADLSFKRLPAVPLKRLLDPA